MAATSPHRVPDWKLFLELGAELLSRETTADQSALIRQFIADHLQADSTIWFAQPAYPLPGESIQQLLPDPKAPALVRSAFSDHSPHTRYRKAENKSHIALPLITQGYLLGVLLVERLGPTPFSTDEKAILRGVGDHAAVALQTTRQMCLKNWRFDQLALVRSVSARIANQRDLDELCRQVTGLIQETFDFYFVSIFTLTDDADTLRFRASSGPAGLDLHVWEQTSIHTGQGMIGTVAQTGQEILASDVTREPLFRYIEALPETRAEVVIPLKVDNRVLGVLDVQNDQARAIHEFDLSVLRTLADNIALAIEGTRMFARLGKRAAQLSAVLEISHAVTSTLDFTALLDVVVQSIRKHFEYEYIHIYSINPGRRKIKYEAGTGARSQTFEDSQVTFNLDDPDGIIPWVAREGKTRLANDVSAEPLYRPPFLRPKSTCAELAIPLEYAGEVLGGSRSAIRKFERIRGRRYSVAGGDECLNSYCYTQCTLVQFRNLAAPGSLIRSVRSPVWYPPMSRWMICSSAFSRNWIKFYRAKPSAIWLLEEDFLPENQGQHSLRLAATRGVDTERLLTIMAEDSAVRDILTAIIDLGSPAIRSRAGSNWPAGPDHGVRPRLLIHLHAVTGW